MTKARPPQDSGSSPPPPPPPPNPEMGRITRPDENAPFSLRLPGELRARATEKAASKGLTVGQYIRDLMEADLSGTTPRRRRGKYDELRHDLAHIHAAIIACGNQIKRDDRLCAIDPRGGRGGDRRCDQEQTDLLRNAVAALILLARSIGAR
jgi:hypothetical protein